MAATTVRILGLFVVIAGVVVVWVGWFSEWICPSGRSLGPCSHGYMGGTAVALFLSGWVLIFLGSVLAAGLTGRTLLGVGIATPAAGAVLLVFALRLPAQAFGLLLPAVELIALGGVFVFLAKWRPRS